MSEILRDFYDSIVFFIYPTVMACLFCIKEEKRKNFWVRITAGGMVSCILSYAISFSTWYVKLNYIPKYILGLIASVVCLFIAYRINSKKGVFYTICGVAIYSVADSVFWLIYAALTLLNIAPSIESWIFVLLDASIVIIVCTIFYFLYVKKVQFSGRGGIKFYEKSLLPPLCVVIVMIIVTQIMPHDIISNDIVTATLILTGYSVSMSGIILYSMYKIFQMSGLRTEMGIVQTIAIKQKEQYETQKENIDYINEKCHDFRKMIEIFKSSGNLSENSIAELYKKISIYDSYSNTGNEVLDTIISEKSLVCEKGKISFTYLADGKSLSFLDTVDICSIFVNMLDNAVEATLKIPDENERLICLKMAVNGNILHISSYNSFKDEPLKKDGDYLTAKEDRGVHGFGIKSIRYTVRKHGGEMNIYTDNNLFNIDILIPIPQTN